MKISAINTNKLQLDSSVKKSSLDFSGKFKEILNSIRGEIPNTLKDKLSTGQGLQAPELLLYGNLGRYRYYHANLIFFGLPGVPKVRGRPNSVSNWVILKRAIKEQMVGAGS